jgi:hypothetical protein
MSKSPTVAVLAFAPVTTQEQINLCLLSKGTRVSTTNKLSNLILRYLRFKGRIIDVSVLS